MTDVHTHNLAAGPDAIINIEPDTQLLAAGRFSTGVHPWRSTEAAALWPLVEALAADPRITAIGECGLAPSAPAERVGKPLIIHCVRAWAELLGVHASVRPAVPWIVHGFRGAPALARQLLDAGMHLSLGEHFRPDTAAIIPADRLHVETDTSSLPIEEIAARVRAARHQQL